MVKILSGDTGFGIIAGRKPFLGEVGLVEIIGRAGAAKIANFEFGTLAC